MGNRNGTRNPSEGPSLRETMDKRTATHPRHGHNRHDGARPPFGARWWFGRVLHPLCPRSGETEAQSHCPGQQAGAGTEPNPEHCSCFTSSRVTRDASLCDGEGDTTPLFYSRLGTGILSFNPPAEKPNAPRSAPSSPPTEPQDDGVRHPQTPFPPQTPPSHRHSQARRGRS